MLKPISICSVLLLLLLSLPGCGGSTGSSTETKKPHVIATSYPLASVTQMLAGPHITLDYPVPVEEEAALWKPTEEQVLALQQADLVLLNGAGHEPWTERVTLSPLNQAVTALGVREQWIRVKDAITHSHGPGGTHTHTGLAPQTWLDPLLFIEQVRVAALSLQKLLPEQAEAIATEQAKLESELQAILADWLTFAGKIKDKPLIASHPVYHYPARRYQWNLQNVHFEPTAAPTAAEWSEFDELLKTHPAKVMLWEAEPLPETRQQLQQRQIEILILDPLAAGNPETNVLEAMRNNLQPLLNWQPSDDETPAAELTE